MNKKVLDTWKPMQFNWNFSKRVFFVFINVDCEYEIMTFHVIYAQIKKERVAALIEYLKLFLKNDAII